LNPIGWYSGGVKSFEIVNSSDGMNISGYNVDCVVFGVSRCREFVYVLQCGSLEVRRLQMNTVYVTFLRAEHKQQCSLLSLLGQCHLWPDSSHANSVAAWVGLAIMAG
jgi:hypothetical protein